MRYTIVLMVLLAAGCLYSPYGSEESQTNQTGEQPLTRNRTSVTTHTANETVSPPPPVPEAPPSVVPAAQEEEENQTNQTGEQPLAGNETVSPPPVPPLPPIVEEPPYMVPAAQEVCATVTPDCASCIAKSGCGWCKSSNSCFSGNTSGPVVSSCPEADWVVTSDKCVVPVRDSECSRLTNCASCLTGSGCKWCIQGSVCTDASSQDSCLGGWLNKSYQCNYASR